MWFYSAEEEAQCDHFWAHFSERSGTHLVWTQASRRVSEIASKDGHTLARVEGVVLFPRTREPEAARRVTVDGTTYKVIRRRFSPRARTPDGDTLISFSWRTHSNGESNAVAHLTSGGSLRFPVRGTSNLNAVMTAIDETWRPVCSLRQVRDGRVGNAVEILIEPGREPTPELLVALAIGYPNLDKFFRTPSSGG
jgi:hypothetical protein